jgi:pimeloyl-ACP methyl ester carboxylesterase
MTWDEKYTEVDGRRVFYRASQKNDGRPTLIHVHGFAISGTYLLPTAELLTDDFDIVVPDLPGYGRSDSPPKPLTIIELGAALGSFMDSIGLDRASFVGNSMGCAITVEFADLFPNRIDHAVLVSPAGGPHSQPLIRAVGQMARDGLHEPPRMMTVATPDYLRFGPINALRLFKAMTRFPAVERLLAMHVPTLAVLGERDPLLPKQSRIDEVAAMSSSTTSVVRLRKAAHAVNYSHPEPLAEVVRRFVHDVPLAGIEGIDVLKQAEA